MNPAIADPGYMHRNGHGRCGMCGDVENRCRGGKAARKAEGWTYDRSFGLGWLCSLCTTYARRSAAELAQEERERQLDADSPGASRTPAGTVRGFGLKRVTAKPQARIKVPRYRKRLAAWRAYYERTGRPVPADLRANVPRFMPSDLPGAP